MKIRIWVFLLMVLLCGSCCFAQDKHELFTEVLRAHVKDGVVDYKSLCKDTRFAQYMEQLRNTDTKKLGSDKEKLVFWINAYNAWTLKIICDNYPLKSITALHSGISALAPVFKTTVWDKNLVSVNGKLTSLNFIEHKILRPGFKEPRIHFAIVCAAKGCTPLRNEAYEAERIDAQLDEQGRIFMAQEQKNKFDVKNKIAYISPIFSWFKVDFGQRDEAVVSFLSKFAPPLAAELMRNKPKEWKIRYTAYDWSLNE